MMHMLPGRLRWLVGLSLVWGFQSFAQSVDELRTAYDVAATRIDAEREKAELGVRTQYLKLLDDYIAYSQARGKLEPVIWMFR